MALVITLHPATADEVTILAFGDSLTQGYGLAQNDGFVPQLERWLQAQGASVRVLNGGVSGDTSAGGAARIDWSLTGDVDAVIVSLGGNDMLRGLPVAAARANLDTILEKVRARNLPVLLVGMRAPGNFGAEYKAEFDAIYSDLAASYDVALFESFLQGLEDTGDRATALREYMQEDALHPNAAGVALVVARMGPDVLILIEGLD